MKHQSRLPRRQQVALQSVYSEMYAGSLEYSDQHLDFLRRQRDAYLQSLKKA
jgi:hypothetical protein